MFLQIVRPIVTKTLADQIEDLLPQTQCTKCGYPACRPYAEAIASGEADINRCPPGGMEGVARLSKVTGRPVIPINPANGLERPRPVAFIDENLCIGCTLCIQACPVDAILGAPKQMHTVLESWCTGCELCIAPCPVYCITMQPVTPTRAWGDADASLARQRYYARNDRLAADKREREQKLAAKSIATTPPTDPKLAEAEARKKAIIAAAMERARAQREAAQPKNLEPASEEVRRQIAEAEARRARLAKERP